MACAPSEVEEAAVGVVEVEEVAVKEVLVVKLEAALAVSEVSLGAPWVQATARERVRMEARAMVKQ